MKTTKYIICMLLACVALYGCQEIEEPVNDIPTVNTYEVVSYGTTTAKLRGISSYRPLSSFGFKFILSTSADFASDCIEFEATWNDDKRERGYEARATGLSPNVTYYCKLVYSDNRGVIEGNVVNFTTMSQFELSKVIHTLWENGETSSFIMEKNMGTFFFYDEKYRNNNIETYCTPNAPKWIPNADIPLNAEWMMVYAYWPYTQTYEMRDNQPYIPVDNNGQDYLYGACEYIAKENTPTNMHMNSAMSHVTFTVNKTENCDIEGTVSEIILVDNGKTLYCNGEMNVTTGEITGIEPMGSTSIHCKFELSHDTPTTIERLMFPASFGESQVQVGIKIAHTNEVIYSYLPAGEWKKGQSYNYPITLTKKLTEGEAIDLGLSVKWASRNVGANHPEEYGDYFAWGETTTNGGNTTNNLYTVELMSQGIINSNKNLTESYDAATTNWGTTWRIPTYDEFKELLDKCKWEWTTYNKVNGCLVTGPNGNSIFLPAAGSRENSSISFAGSFGLYWTATANGNSLYSYNIEFCSGYELWEHNLRHYGYSVRPVAESSSDTPETTTALIVGDVQVENWGTNNEGGTIIVQQ